MGARAIKDGETYSEKIGGRGAGALLLIGRVNAVSAYYRYTDSTGKRPWVELGVLGAEIGLKEARERCQALNTLRREHADLREWLDSEQERERVERETKRRAQEQAAQRATLKDLLDDYIARQKFLQRASADKTESTLKAVVYRDAPALAAFKVQDIEPSHIVDILRPISSRGSKVQRNRVRSHLHAAFQYGLRSEYDETRVSAKSYGLKANPVAAVPPLEGVENAGTRALNEPELRQFYSNLPDVGGVGIVMATFMRFIIALGGQRPLQVLTAKWSDYDMHARTIRIIDRKGRGSKPRVHLVPLTERAFQLLEQVKPITSAHPWPFTSTGTAPLSIVSLKNAINRFLASEHGKVGDETIPHFTAKDIRRTCKQIMVRAGIRRDLRNLLQNHGQTGVDVTAYANDPVAYLPEKLQAMIQYELALSAILKGKRADNVIDMQSWRVPDKSN
jgi:integrase